jgi:hypothetical protein
MKRLFLALVCAAFVSGSAFASCGGCGEGTKEGEKEKDSTQQTLVAVF